MGLRPFLIVFTNDREQIMLPYDQQQCLYGGVAIDSVIHNTKYLNNFHHAYTLAAPFHSIRYRCRSGNGIQSV